MRTACAAATLLALAVIPAFAEDDDNIGAGAGVSTCSQFNEFRKADRETMLINYTAWAQGFMSSQNLNSYNSAGIFRQLSEDVKLQQGFLVDFCNKFPNSLYVNAVKILYETFPVRIRK